MRLFLETLLDAVVVMVLRVRGGLADHAANTFGGSARSLGQPLPELIIPRRYRDAHVKTLISFYAPAKGRSCRSGSRFRACGSPARIFRSNPPPPPLQQGR